ncbi:MAG: hypothetical protein ACXWV0_03640 [Flavisolibacter sp.]
MYLAGQVLSFLKTYGWVLLLSSLAGLALGLFSFFTKPPLYSSRLILHSIIITNQEQIEIIDNWKSLMGKGERAQVARMMNLPENVLNQVGSISAKEIQKVYSTNNPNGFLVDVMVKDTSILRLLQNGIVHGLSGNSYVSSRVAARRKKLEEMARSVEDEMIQLTRTQQNIDSLVISGRGTNTFMLDISSLHAQKIGLKEKLSGYREELPFVNAVQVLQDFTTTSKPVQPRLLKSVVLGLAAGLVIGYFIAMILYLRRQLKNRAAIIPI